jgi:hypothetical protein
MHDRLFAPSNPRAASIHGQHRERGVNDGGRVSPGENPGALERVHVAAEVSEGRAPSPRVEGVQVSEQVPTKKRVGYDATGETTVARAGGEEFWWDWYWRAELERVAKANPGCHVVGVSKQTGISFGGIFPANWNGKRVEVVA